jgi:hypothetical protein
LFDTINLERRGVPSVAIVHDRFENSARMQGKLLGLSSVKIVAIPEGRPGDSPEELRNKTDAVWGKILESITGSQQP